MMASSGPRLSALSLLMGYASSSSSSSSSSSDEDEETKEIPSTTRLSTSSSSQTSSSSSSGGRKQLGTCQVCLRVLAQYTCPRCGVHTCSVACVRAHKETKPCSGRRDRAAKVEVDAFTDANLHSDYCLLEEAQSSIHRIQRWNVHERDEGRSVSTLPALRWFRNACIRRGTWMTLMSEGLERRMENTSCVSRALPRRDGKRSVSMQPEQQPEQRVLWRVELRFCRDEFRIVEDCVDEEESLDSILSRYFDPSRSEHAAIRQRLRSYRAAYDTQQSSRSCSSPLGDSSSLAALVEIPHRPSNSPLYVSLLWNTPLRDLFSGLEIIEYPSILFVFVEDLPKNYRVLSPEEELQYRSLVKHICSEHIEMHDVRRRFHAEKRKQKKRYHSQRKDALGDVSVSSSPPIDLPNELPASPSHRVFAEEPFPEDEEYSRRDSSTAALCSDSPPLHPTSSNLHNRETICQTKTITMEPLSSIPTNPPSSPISSQEDKAPLEVVLDGYPILVGGQAPLTLFHSARSSVVGNEDHYRGQRRNETRGPGRGRGGRGGRGRGRGRGRCQDSSSGIDTVEHLVAGEPSYDLDVEGTHSVSAGLREEEVESSSRPRFRNAREYGSRDHRQQNGSSRYVEDDDDLPDNHIVNSVLLSINADARVNPLTRVVSS